MSFIHNGSVMDLEDIQQKQSKVHSSLIQALDNYDSIKLQLDEDIYTHRHHSKSKNHKSSQKTQKSIEREAEQQHVLAFKDIEEGKVGVSKKSEAKKSEAKANVRKVEAKSVDDLDNDEEVESKSENKSAVDNDNEDESKSETKSEGKEAQVAAKRSLLKKIKSLQDEIENLKETIQDDDITAAKKQKREKKLALLESQLKALQTEFEQYEPKKERTEAKANVRKEEAKSVDELDNEEKKETDQDEEKKETQEEPEVKKDDSSNSSKEAGEEEPEAQKTESKTSSKKTAESQEEKEETNQEEEMKESQKQDGYSKEEKKANESKQAGKKTSEPFRVDRSQAHITPLQPHQHGKHHHKAQKTYELSNTSHGSWPGDTYYGNVGGYFDEFGKGAGVQSGYFNESLKVPEQRYDPYRVKQVKPADPPIQWTMAAEKNQNHKSNQKHRIDADRFEDDDETWMQTFSEVFPKYTQNYLPSPNQQ